MLCGVEEPLDVQQLRLTARMEGFDEDFKERGDGDGFIEVNGGFWEMDWFKGKFTGNHRFSHEIWGLNQ